MGYCCSKPYSGRRPSRAPPAPYRRSFHYQSGRLYPGDQSDHTVCMPCDESEHQRLSLQHTVLVKHWLHLYSSPIDLDEEDGLYVLDACCRGGDWALEVGRRHPRARVTALDAHLSTARMHTLTMPSRDGTASTTRQQRERPRNVQFLKCDIISSKIPIADGKCVLSRLGMTFATFTLKHWETIVIPELLRVTRPDSGWIELMDSDCTIYGDGPICRRLSQGLATFLRENGMSDTIRPYLVKLLKANSQVGDVYHEERDIVLGKPGGQYGELALRNVTSLWDALRPSLTESMNISPQHYDALVETFVRECHTNRTVWRTFRVWARKVGGGLSSGGDVSWGSGSTRVESIV